MPAEPITDPGDPRLADYRDLTDAEARRAVERSDTGEGIFIVEGAHALGRLLESRYPVRSVLVTPRQAEARADLLARVPAPVLVAELEVMSRVTGFNIHRGVVAAADRLPLPDASEVAGDARHLLVLEGVNDHENLGALFRTAAALGIDAVLACPRTADHLYRRSIRVSQGWALRLPVARVPDWPTGLTDLLATSGHRLVALTPAADAEPIHHLVGTADRFALMVGAEGPGLTGAALAAADVRACIPIRAEVDSLNVATAAGIAAAVLIRP